MNNDLNVNEQNQPEPISTLYTGECSSVSGRSTLTYLIGKHDTEGSLHLRIAGNSGKGMWCKDWASVQAIEAIVIGSGELKAKSFHCLHPGKSINTGGFVLAALRDLGVVRPVEANTRHHEHVPTSTIEKAVAERLTNAEVTSPPKVRRKAKERA